MELCVFLTFQLILISKEDLGDLRSQQDYLEKLFRSSHSFNCKFCKIKNLRFTFTALLRLCFFIRRPRKTCTPRSRRSNYLLTAWTVSSPKPRPQRTMPCALNWTRWRPTTSASAAGWTANVKPWRCAFHISSDCYNVLSTSVFQWGKM